MLLYGKYYRNQRRKCQEELNEILAVGGVDKRPALGYTEGRKGRCDKRLARISYCCKTKALKPSLGRVAVSAFYSDRHSPVKNVKGQCNRHDHHLLCRGVANRLPFCAAPGAENRHHCQNTPKNRKSQSKPTPEFAPRRRTGRRFRRFHSAPADGSCRRCPERGLGFPCRRR